MIYCFNYTNRSLRTIFPLLCYNYSNKINLPSFTDSKIFKHDNVTLNNYQKHELVFMKHLAMWAPQGSIIIDVALGDGMAGA